VRVLRLLAAVSLAAGSLAFAAPVAAGDPCYHDFDVPQRSEGTDPQIMMMPCAFAPTVVRVPPGTTVQWFSGPSFVHLLTGADQEWGSRDDQVEPGSVVAYRFDRPGIYPYACALHRGMSGTIVVGDGVAAAAAASAGSAVVRVTPPDGSAATPLAAATRAPQPAVASVAPAPAAARSDAPAVVGDRLPVSVLLLGGAAFVGLFVLGFAAGRRLPSRRAGSALPSDR
jgi:plastocyanin